MTTPDPQQLDLERLLFRYSMALERGDFDTVTSILQIAAHNADLNRMIQELDAEYAFDSHPEPTLSGDPDMAQLTRPLTFPLLQKRKQGQSTRRSTLLFPVAAAIAVALVGLSVLSFNPQPNDNEAGQFGLNLGSETATPTPVPMQPDGAGTVAPLLYLVPPSWVTLNGSTAQPPLLATQTSTPMPFDLTAVPTGGLFITFTPTAVGPTLVPTEISPSAPFTATPFGTGGHLPTIVPPDLGLLPTVIPPDPSALAAYIPSWCGGVIQGEGDTRVYPVPFADRTQAVPLGLYAPRTPVILMDMRFDLAQAEIWFYVNEQGWINAYDVALLPECLAALEAVEIFSEVTDFLNSLPPLNPASPTFVPTVPPPSLEATPTSTPFLPTVPPRDEVTATPTPLR